jgi:hypothetical protein
MSSARRCKICNKPRDTLYVNWNDNGDIWLYCCSCGKSYNVLEYCKMTGTDYRDIVLNGNINFNNRTNKNEVNRLDWPAHFISLLDSRAYRGKEYLKERGLRVEGDIFYDIKRNGIVFPLYYEMYFCGAQIRLINPMTNEYGQETKMISMPGTRTSILIYNWNQLSFLLDVKNIVITEGAFNCLSLMQAFDSLYLNKLSNPYKVLALSGSGSSHHHIKKIKELKDKGYNIIIAGDNDQAGLKMISKFIKEKALTHFSLPKKEIGDWNDIMKEKGEEELIKVFLSNMENAKI